MFNGYIYLSGPNFTTEAKTKNQNIGFKFIKTLLANVNGCAFSFRFNFL